MQKKDKGIEVSTANDEKRPEERKFKCVEYIDEIDDARVFLNYLDMKDEKWGSGFTSPWIFRGQGNARWGLIPTAWRKEANRLLRPIMISLMSVAENRILSTQYQTNKFAVEVLTKTAAIFELTFQFVELADELGFWIPEMEDVISGVEFIRGRWPSYWLIWGDRPPPAFALAQHHGIPTQFLDWTRNPLFAAFFAADSCLTEEGIGEWNPDGSPHETPDELAVWAINLSLISTDPKDSNALSPFTCPRSQHSFLHAQDALMLWHSRGDDFHLEKGYWPDFQEVIEASYSEGQPRPLKKINLPSAEANQLLRLLYKSRLSKAHLMPTYDNIAKTVKDTYFIKALEQSLQS